MMAAIGEQVNDCVPSPEPEQKLLFTMAELPARVGLDDSDAPGVPRRRRLRVVQPLLRIDPDLDEWVDRARAEQPKTRGDCDRAVGDEPCPYVSCRMHLWADQLADSDVDDGGGLPRRMRQFEHLVETEEPENWGETCALRVAERVTPEPSATGKWEGHSIDGEVIATPGPILDGGPGNRVWLAAPEEFASPRKVDAAVLGRFLGWLSREQIRKDLNRAAALFRADPAIRQWAVDRGLDPDRLLEIDDD
jgi:hypothetical protein